MLIVEVKRDGRRNSLSRTIPIFHVHLCARHYVTRREYKTASMFAVKVSCAKWAAFNTYQCVVAAADGSGSPGLGGPHIELGAFRPSRGGRCG